MPESGHKIDNWHYHPGDNPAWAEPGFDHSGWRVSGSVRLDKLSSRWTGIGWFRAELELDPCLVDSLLGLMIFQSGASEIYLNGKLIRRLGQPSADPEREEIYVQRLPVPVAFEFIDTGKHILAIRYSNHNPHYATFMYLGYGFSAWIYDYDLAFSHCLGECDLSDKLKKYLNAVDNFNRVIATGSDRVTDIVRRLRSFARLDEAELKSADVNEGIEDTLTLVHHELKHGIEVICDFGKIPEIACYPGQLNQVFLNLIINARQAISGEGKLEIATYLEDGLVVIRISDNGCGIKPEIMDKIFDPGFTTKGVGIGTGLGLSICYQIIEAHHGNIEVDSRPGEGTTFTIRLPVDLDKNLKTHSLWIYHRE